MAENESDSLNDFVRMSYNNRFVKNIFSKLSSNAEFDINNPPIEEIIKYGSIRAWYILRLIHVMVNFERTIDIYETRIKRNGCLMFLFNCL